MTKLTEGTKPFMMQNFTHQRDENEIGDTPNPRVPQPAQVHRAVEKPAYRPKSQCSVT